MAVMMMVAVIVLEMVVVEMMTVMSHRVRRFGCSRCLSELLKRQGCARR